MTLPNFFIIGAGRSGTTSPYHYLTQHPQVYMSPVKEPRFFAWDGEPEDADPRRRRLNARDFPFRTLEEYKRLFAGVSGERAIGEATPLYLVSPTAPARLARHLPEARLIAILRNPIERAFANHLSHVRDGKETWTFEQAVHAELVEGRTETPDGWPGYLSIGRYDRHLRRYLRHFDRKQLRVYLFEDLQADAGAVLRDIFCFLEVDPEFTPDMSVRYNASGLPKSALVHRVTGKNALSAALKSHLPVWIRRPAYAFVMNLRGHNLAKPELPKALRAELLACFRDDVLRLQELIGRDLSHWLRPGGPHGAGAVNG